MEIYSMDEITIFYEKRPLASGLFSEVISKISFGLRPGLFRPYFVVDKNILRWLLFKTHVIDFKFEIAFFLLGNKAQPDDPRLVFGK